MSVKRRSVDSDKLYDEPSKKNTSKTTASQQVEDDDEESDDDFVSIVADVFRKINYKVAAFLFLVGIFIMSDLYEGVLRKFNGITEEGCVTSRGSVFQLTMLVLAYIVVDLLTKYEFI